MSAIPELRKVSILFVLLLNSSSFATDDKNSPPEGRRRSVTREHLSTIREENFDRVMGRLKFTETKKDKLAEAELEDYFLKLTRYIQKTKEKNYVNLAKMVIYSYPFFTNEETLFQFLTKKKEEFSSFIPVFLRQLALEAMPNGLDKFRAAETSFNSLKDGLVDDPLFLFLFQSTMDHCYIDNISTLPKLGATDNPKEWFERWPIDRFVYALSQRDINLYCAISFADLRSHLEKPSCPPSSILALTQHFDRTQKWICSEILKREEPRERTKMIQLFRIIGRMMFNEKNYHGAMQVVLAFSQVQVTRTLSAREAEEINGEDYMKCLTMENNYKSYRELLSYPGSKSVALPILPVFFKDILFARETKAYEAMGQVMEDFYRSQKFLPRATTFNENDLEVLKFVSQFPDIHESTLDEMSNLIKKWTLVREEKLPQNLESWTTSHFYTFFEKYEDQAKMSDLIYKNIYSGKDLAAYLKGSASVQEADVKLDRLGFTLKLKNLLFGEIHKTLADFIDAPILKASKSQPENLESEGKLITKSKSSKRSSADILQVTKSSEKLSAAGVK